ncbi:GntR family transcriptional regulator [Rhizobium sp. BG4]|uniref:GntR family transcriptional regulator n=1 Tax=Rhizobium sp. BG4 TaxID=2613770 RepID=UPI001FEFBB65|nr:GntR family transcriptional regulator [Rhizobium sp. BG4]
MPTLAEIAARPRARFKTAMEIAVEGLREAILEGAIKADSPLRQEELAKVFGVSRMPIREALRQLEAEGLVLSAPHRGAVVAELLPAEVREIDQIRSALETLALSLSLPLLTDRQFEEAEAILDRMEACQDAAKWTALNEQFHNSLYAGTASPRLKTLIAGQYVALARYSNVHVGALDYRRRADEEHRGLLEACRTRDIAVATSALSKHIRASGEEIAKVLEGSQQDT